MKLNLWRPRRLPCPQCGGLCLSALLSSTYPYRCLYCGYKGDDLGYVHKSMQDESSTLRLFTDTDKDVVLWHEQRYSDGSKRVIVNLPRKRSR